MFERLEAAFGTSAPSQSLALEYGVGMSDMTYHAQHRQSEALSRQRYEAEQHQAPADDPRDPTYRHAQVQREMPSLVAEADRLQQAALRAAGLGPALFVLRDMGALLVKLAQALEAR